MALPQLFQSYLAPLWQALKTQVQLSDLPVDTSPIDPARLPGLDVNALAPLGIAINPAGTAFTYDNSVKLNQLFQAYLDQKGYVVGGGVTLSSIAVNGPASVNEGGSGTYTVTGTYSDNSTAAITSGITWGSNTPNGVLTIASNSTTGDGTTTTVTATVGSKSNTKTVSVVDTTPAPTTSGTMLLASDLVQQENVAFSSNQFASANGTALWRATTAKKLAAGASGWVQWVLAAASPSGMLLLNPGTSLPNGAGDYGNTHGVKKSQGNGPNVVTGGAGTNYPSVSLAVGDIIRNTVTATQVITSISHDNGATFTAFATNARYKDTNGNSTALTLMLAGEPSAVLGNVTYYGLS